MRKTELTREARMIISENNGLRLYLENLQTGRQSTPHSWLYEKEDAQHTLERWIPLMEKGNSKSPFAKEFNIFDSAQIEKFGPQGAVPPIDSKEVWDVIDPLYSPTEYDSPSALSQWIDVADKFGQSVFRQIRRATPLPYFSVIDDMKVRDSLNTNSGFPRFVRRNKVRDMEVKDAEAGKAYDYPAIILFRFYYGKLRPVWMFPMSLNLVEFSFQQPIQKALQNSPLDWVRQYLTPWAGYEHVKKTLTAQWHGEWIIGGDTTKMDAHMRPAQLNLVYHVVKWLFQEKYWDDLYRSLMWITEIPLLISDKYQLEGVHGLASGSGWTQLSETVLQMLMAFNAGVTGQGIGDDFYWMSDANADELVRYLGSFGLPANPAKQSIAKDSLTFLQRMNHQGFFSRDDARILGAYYPTIRALGSMLLPEKFHKPKDWNSDMFCTRNYTILENTVDDPCFDEFATFVARGHKDMIPFAKKSASELNAIQKEARRVPGLFPSYNQEKLDRPLGAFTSIQFVKEHL